VIREPLVFVGTCDRMARLVVLDRGRIVEEGTHERLLAAYGHYAALWRRQSGGFLGIDRVEGRRDEAVAAAAALDPIRV
jgi:ATP-binding cassette, subfamily B, multidrug efflux pump